MSVVSIGMSFCAVAIEAKGSRDVDVSATGMWVSFVKTSAMGLCVSFVEKSWQTSAMGLCVSFVKKSKLSLRTFPMESLSSSEGE